MQPPKPAQIAAARSRMEAKEGTDPKDTPSVWLMVGKLFNYSPIRMSRLTDLKPALMTPNKDTMIIVSCSIKRFNKLTSIPALVLSEIVFIFVWTITKFQLNISIYLVYI